MLVFMFPGQGSFESGMGRDVAEAVPEAMAVYDEASLASGMDLKDLCFNRPAEDLVHTEVQQPALVTTSLSLDGYIEHAAGDPGWAIPDDELHRHFNDLERDIDTHLYGRRMYELMAAYWPNADQNPAAPPYDAPLICAARAPVVVTRRPSPRPRIPHAPE